MKKSTLTFRFNRIISILFLGTLLSTAVHAHRDLTIVNWGGDSARAQMQAWLLPWENTHEDEFTDMLYYNGGLTEIRDQVNTTNVKWDVVNMDQGDLILACEEGLLEKLNHANLPDSSNDFINSALVNECGVGAVVWATVYAYDTSVFSDKAPTTLADFFDLKSFPGNRGLRSDPRGTMEWALMAAGVPAADVYKKLSTFEGLDMAFKQLDKIKGNIVWWSAGGEPADLLSNSRVTMSAAWNGRLYRPIVENDANIAIVWDSQIWNIDFLAIPKGSRNLEKAKNFITFATSTQKQIDFSKHIPYGPTRKSAQGKTSEVIKKYLPTQNMSETSLRMDASWWAANIDNLQARFDQWLGPLALSNVR